MKRKHKRLVSMMTCFSVFPISIVLGIQSNLHWEQTNKRPTWDTEIDIDSQMPQEPATKPAESANESKFEWNIKPDSLDSKAHSKENALKVESKYNACDYNDPNVNIGELSDRSYYLELETYKKLYNFEFRQKFFNFNLSLDYLTTLTNGYYPYSNIKEAFEYFGLTVSMNYYGQVVSNFKPVNTDNIIYLFLNTTVPIENKGDYIFELELDKNGIQYKNHGDNYYGYLIKVELSKI